MVNVGKKAAGRLLDGREWNEMPQDVAWMLHTIDRSKFSVVMPGETLDLGAYADRLSAAMANSDAKDAKHLLAAKL